LSIKDIFIYSTIPLIAAITLNYLLLKYNYSLAYILFFSIAFCSALGLTKTLTGSYSQSQYLYLYGLSFYTVTLAYLSKTKKINIVSSFVATNPLLLITGPIVTSFKVTHNKPLINRFNYYFPYIILGIFLHQVIATPLTQTFFLKESTDLVSTVAYGIIFEIFVYCNFCGLSLIIFGIFGMLGIRIPLNFKQPFSSKNLVEYWRGWHTSLSIVLKKLFYLPLKQSLGPNIAIFGVFLSSSLWHGVTANFIYWGVFQALLFIFTVKLLKSNVRYIPSILLIFAVPFARILFSDDNIPRLNSKLYFNFTNFDSLYEINLLANHVKIALTFGLIFILLEIIFRKNKLFLSKNYKFYRTPVAQFGLIILIIFLIHSSGNLYAVYGQR
jgi:D-alanyl-lipoteichoic acid acyltransferase DltB (MBOAT superfamily)